MFFYLIRPGPKPYCALTGHPERLDIEQLDKAIITSVAIPIARIDTLMIVIFITLIFNFNKCRLFILP